MIKWKSHKRKIKAGVVLFSVVFLIAFTERKQQGSLCSDIIIELHNQYENHFLEAEDIRNIVLGSNIPVLGTSLNRIRLKEIEERIELNKHVLKADLFGDLKENLIVRVTLRRVMARVVQPDGRDAYIAEDGVIVPVSEKYTSRQLLVSGAKMKELMEPGDLRSTEEGRKIWELISWINARPFWKALIAQINVDSKLRVTMYPQVTAQIVEFGEAEDLATKFNKLMIFYKRILPTKGWNHYDRVNLEYESQIIAE